MRKRFAELLPRAQRKRRRGGYGHRAASGGCALAAIRTCRASCCGTFGVTPDEPDGRPRALVVFVDISGFTKLSEKLAKVGKEGAEEITDAIEACFTELLAVAYANGGSLLKFGGDALLLLFEEDDHVASACRAARLDARALREVGRIETPGGARPAADVGRRAHGRVPLLPRRRFASGARRHRSRLDREVGDGARRRRGRDRGEPEARPRCRPRCLGGTRRAPGSLLKREPPGHHVVGPSARRYSVDPDAVAHCLSTAVREHVLAGGGRPSTGRSRSRSSTSTAPTTLIEQRGPAAVAAELQELLARHAGGLRRARRLLPRHRRRRRRRQADPDRRRADDHRRRRGADAAGAAQDRRRRSARSRSGSA